MGTSIRATGELTYKDPTQEPDDDIDYELKIESYRLQQGPHVEWSKPSYKGDKEEYHVVFSKDTPVGLFEWKVTYSMDHSGVEVEDVELQAPTGVEYDNHMKFTS